MNIQKCPNETHLLVSTCVYMCVCMDIHVSLSVHAHL